MRFLEPKIVARISTLNMLHNLRSCDSAPCGGHLAQQDRLQECIARRRTRYTEKGESHVPELPPPTKKVCSSAECSLGRLRCAPRLRAQVESVAVRVRILFVFASWRCEGLMLPPSSFVEQRRRGAPARARRRGSQPLRVRFSMRLGHGARIHAFMPPTASQRRRYGQATGPEDVDRCVHGHHPEPVISLLRVIGRPRAGVKK